MIAFSPSPGDIAGAGAPGFRVQLATLGGRPSEEIFTGLAPAGAHGAFALHRSDRWLVGCAAVEGGLLGDLEAATRQLYAELFAATGRDWRLARIWNYVPAINGPGPAGLENYRAFCRGRSLAFEAAFGGGFEQQLPAASAVGGPAGSSLAVIFASTRDEVHHFENPAQVPAYEYPPEHGPRPPSFARATLVHPASASGSTGGAAGCDAFVSGTAAIVGHTTVAPGDTAAQLACTLDNLAAISRACGLGRDLAAGRSAARFFKVYLRHAADFAPVAAQLERTLLGPGDEVTYLHADICRATLNIEIEATILGARAIPTVGG